MKILIIGARGQLGTDLCHILHKDDLIPLGHSDIDITDIQSVKAAFESYSPDIVINTAAYVKVDDCEAKGATAFKVNGEGTRNVAEAAERKGVKLVYISTDYIFDGKRDKPYTESDIPNPLNIYGKSKLAGESYVREINKRYLIVRGSALFGVSGSSAKGGNFVETIIRLAKEKKSLNVVSDQVFSPTYTKDLANKIVQIISGNVNGILHVTNSGSCSWYEFASEIIKQSGLKTGVNPVTSECYPQKAVRPKNSVLDNYRLRTLGMNDMRHWKVALTDYLISRGHITGKISSMI
jgi:dTDP-4-dehydrorhamnose reductase